jgi:putative heme-binding domain-containing protein
VVGGDAIRGLARYENAQVPKLLLKMYPGAKHDHRPAIIETLASRPSYAGELLNAVKKGTVNRDDIPAATAGVIASHPSDELKNELEALWGSVRTSSDEKQRLIAHYRESLLLNQSKNASPANGRVHFNKICASCHKMFGQGKSIGPDLTGSNRDNLDYLLDNIIDPSRVVPAELRQSVLLLNDGRVITGTITRQDDKTMTIQTATDELHVAKDNVESSNQLQTSLMPEGLLSQLTGDEVRDLIAYLQSAGQVELAEPLPTAEPSR